MISRRHQKPADIYIALQTVNWFVTGRRYLPGSRGSWDLVGRQMEKWMLEVLERRQYRRLKRLEHSLKVMGEQLRRSAQALNKSVETLRRMR